VVHRKATNRHVCCHSHEGELATRYSRLRDLVSGRDRHASWLHHNLGGLEGQYVPQCRLPRRADCHSMRRCGSVGGYRDDHRIQIVTDESLPVWAYFYTYCRLWILCCKMQSTSPGNRYFIQHDVRASIVLLIVSAVFGIIAIGRQALLMAEKQESDASPSSEG
jgi:hypothetical protein